MDGIDSRTPTPPRLCSTLKAANDGSEAAIDPPGCGATRGDPIDRPNDSSDATPTSSLVVETKLGEHGSLRSSSSPSSYEAVPDSGDDVCGALAPSQVDQGATADRSSGETRLVPVLNAVAGAGYWHSNCDSHANAGGGEALSNSVVHDVVHPDARPRANSRSPSPEGVNQGESGGLGCGNNNECKGAGGSSYRQIYFLLRGCDSGPAHQVRALHQGGVSHDPGREDQSPSQQGWDEPRVHRVPVRFGRPLGRDPPAEGRQSKRSRALSRANPEHSFAGPCRPEGNGGCRSSTISSVSSTMWDGPGSDARGTQCAAAEDGAPELQASCGRGSSSVRRAFDFEPEAAGIEDAVSRTVGGVPPVIRGMAMQRTRGGGGDTLADVGASPCIEGNARTPRVDQPRRDQITSGASSAARTHRYPCRRDDCCQALREARTRARDAEKRLERELGNRHNEIIGAVRRAGIESGRDRLQSEMCTVRADLKAALVNRNVAETLARRLSIENGALSESLATEKATVLMLRGKYAASQKQAAIRSRKEAAAARKVRAKLHASTSERLRQHEKFVKQREKVVEGREREVAAREADAQAMESSAKNLRKRADNREREAERKEAKAEVAIISLRARLEAEACMRAELAEAKADAFATKAETKAAKAEAQRNLAERRAAEARSLAESSIQIAREAEKAATSSEWVAKLTLRREERAKAQVASLAEKLKGVAPSTCDRTPEEWSALKGWARYKAAQREVAHIKSFFTLHDWRIQDIARALGEIDGLVERLFDTKPFFSLHFKRVGDMVKRIEHEHYGVEFGLMLHYDMRLPLPKIVQLTQAASKSFSKSSDFFAPKPMLWDPYHTDSYRSTAESKALRYVAVPRIAPPVSKLLPIMRKLESMLGVEPAEDGRIAFKSFAVVVQEMLAQDPGRYDMPELAFYMGGGIEFPLIISFDGTGYGTQQFNTVAVRNPYHPHSALQLRVFGLGNCGDDRSGTRRVLADNLVTINNYINTTACITCTPEGHAEPVAVMPHIYIVTDVAALRHTEHLANSGWCGCMRDFALRETPAPKPQTVAAMHTLLAQCHAPSKYERYTWSHTPHPGEDLPHPCTALGCAFAHNRATAKAEYDALLAEEAQYNSDITKAGKAKFSKFRMAHAHTHHNVQPGQYGRPMLEHDLCDQILDPLHYSKLGLGKTPWKHGILNNASDDAREAISSQLKAWKHPLDCNRKDNNRQRAAKWFTGEAWSSFCAGHGGSPGGPIAIATLVLIIADDMQQRGVPSGSGNYDAVDAVEGNSQGPACPVPVPQLTATARTSTSRRDKFAAANAAKNSQDNPVTTISTLPLSELQHQPSQMELNANPDDINVIREMFGSRGQTIINALLAWDAYLAWYYALENIECALFDTKANKESAALHNCRLAIDMHEMFERVSIRYHKSFLPHAAIFKVTQNILDVGDVKAFSTSALELQNAETKRTATSSGSRRLTTTTSGVKRTSQKSIGPGRLTVTKGYSTTMVLSTLKHLMVTNVLRRGSGLYATPESRRKERLFGVSGKGRISLPSSGVKLEARMQAVNAEYLPCDDTCISAFVRLLAARAEDLSGSGTFC